MSSSFLAMVSIIRGTIRIISGLKSWMFFITRSRESLMQIMEPREMALSTSRHRQ